MIFLDIEAPSKPQYFTLQQVLCKDVMSVNGKEFSLSLSLSLSRVCVLPGNNSSFFQPAQSRRQRDSKPVWPDLSTLQPSPPSLCSHLDGVAPRCISRPPWSGSLSRNMRNCVPECSTGNTGTPEASEERR